MKSTLPSSRRLPLQLDAGDIDHALYCLVFTFRGSNVRAISLRKANRKEIERYGRQTKI